MPNTAARARAVSVNAAFLTQPQPAAPAAGGLEIAILPDPSVYDGRFANNGWLQELPNPLTKITWENVALVSPRTAARLGLKKVILPAGPKQAARALRDNLPAGVELRLARTVGEAIELAFA